MLLATVFSNNVASCMGAFKEEEGGRGGGVLRDFGRREGGGGGVLRDFGRREAMVNEMVVSAMGI